MCAGYVGGFLDGQAFRTLSSGTVTKGSEVNPYLGYCFGPNVTTGQLVLVFKKYLIAHPETLDHPPSVLLNDALKKGFRCK